MGELRLSVAVVGGEKRGFCDGLLLFLLLLSDASLFSTCSNKKKQKKKMMMIWGLVSLKKKW